MAETGVAAVDRALSILDAFVSGAPRQTLAQLAKQTGLYKSTILRLAASLERANYLRRFPDGSYSLGPALLQLGAVYQSSFELRDYVLPALERLGQATGESTSFYIKDGDERVCLFRVNSLQHRLLHYVTPGTRLPLRTGAAGAVIAAFTEPQAPEYAAVRSARVAFSHADRVTDTAAIAAPVFAAAAPATDGQARGFVGAMSLAGPITRFTPELLPGLQRALEEEARRLSGELGWVERAK